MDSAVEVETVIGVDAGGLAFLAGGEAGRVIEGCDASVELAAPVGPFARGSAPGRP